MNKIYSLCITYNPSYSGFIAKNKSTNDTLASYLYSGRRYSSINKLRDIDNSTDLSGFWKYYV